MRLGHPVPDPPAMGYVVLIVKGAVPVVVSMANRAAYTVASCFPIEETVPLFPSIVGTRNPRDDRTVLITVTNPIQTLLVSHAHLLTGFSRIFPPSWEVGTAKWPFRCTGQAFLGHTPPGFGQIS